MSIVSRITDWYMNEYMSSCKTKPSKNKNVKDTVRTQVAKRIKHTTISKKQYLPSSSTAVNVKRLVKASQRKSNTSTAKQQSRKQRELFITEWGINQSMKDILEDYQLCKTLIHKAELHEYDEDYDIEYYCDIKMRILRKWPQLYTDLPRKWKKQINFLEVIDSAWKGLSSLHSTHSLGWGVQSKDSYQSDSSDDEYDLNDPFIDNEEINDGDDDVYLGNFYINTNDDIQDKNNDEEEDNDEVDQHRSLIESQEHRPQENLQEEQEEFPEDQPQSEESEEEHQTENKTPSKQKNKYSYTEIETIIDHRVESSDIYVLVKWIGYDECENSWINVSEVDSKLLCYHFVDTIYSYTDVNNIDSIFHIDHVLSLNLWIETYDRKTTEQEKMRAMIKFSRQVYEQLWLLCKNYLMKSDQETIEEPINEQEILEEAEAYELIRSKKNKKRKLIIEEYDL